MIGVRKSEIPQAALTQSYVGRPGTRVDCYVAHTKGDVSLEEFVGSFYRGKLFGIERWLIEKVVGHGSSEAQLKTLLAGEEIIFSAWTQIERNADQLIMQDYQGRTCSWFMVEPNSAGTDLYFGSIIQPTDYLKRGEGLSKLIFTILLPVHGLYSRLLLGQAAKRFR